MLGWCVTYVVVFILSLPIAEAQEFSYRHFTDEDGLPNMEIFHLYQDSKGYLWLGTEAGLCRFDGQHFKRYEAETALGRAISRLREDSQGRIWMCNFVGQIFYLEDDTIKEFILPKHIKRYYSAGYEIDEEDNVYVNSDHLYKYIARTKKWIKIDEKSVSEIIRKGNELWGLSVRGRAYLISKRGLKKVLRTSEEMEITPLKEVLVGVENGIKNKLYIIPRKTRNDKTTWKKLKKDHWVNEVYQDEKKNIWLAGQGGIRIINEKGEPLFKKRFLPNEAVSYILKDREGNIWISTLGGGLFFVPSLEILFYNRSNSLFSDDHINRMTTDANGHLYLGSVNGRLYKTDKELNILRQRQVAEDNKNIEVLFYHPRHHQLWLEAWRYNIIDTTLTFRERYAISSANKDLDLYDEQRLAGCAASGAYLLYDSTFASVRSDRSDVKSLQEGMVYLRNKRTRAIEVEQPQKRIWVGYADGLYYYEDFEEREWKPNNEVITPLIVYSLAQGNDGIIWVATSERGLYGLKNKKMVYHFDKENGLNSNFCRVVKTFGDQVWVATDRGLHYIDTKNNEVYTFNRQDGLISNEVTDLIVQDGMVYLATANGIMRFPESELSPNKVPPPIYITAFRIKEKNQSLQPVYRLSHEQNNIIIDFQGIAYRSRGTFSYKYKMVGVDSTWIYTSSDNNFARYPSLPSGDFEFMVKAINEDGVESEGTAIIHITVALPFWRTWWFLTLVGIGLITVVSIFFWFRIRTIQRNAHVAQELRGSQLATLKVQMNPHFIFNALNSIQEFILLNEKRLANQYLGKFADLMRLTLDMSNEVTVSLEDELRALNLYLELEAIRFEESLTYQIIVDKEVIPEEIEIPSMLVQPYVENAIKHGLLHKKENKKLTVTFKLSDKEDYLSVEVEDNGIGRRRSAEIKAAQKFRYKSFATSATQKRLELLNYGRKNIILVKIIDLYNENGEAKGTKVVFNIPFQN